MKAVNLMPVDVALDELMRVVHVVQREQELSLAVARGRVLAESIRSDAPVPAFDNSAMDGYAVNVSDCLMVNAVLPVALTIAAGSPVVELVRGSAARIFTGAPIPRGANAVVMQENAKQDAGRVCIGEKPSLGQNVRLAGHDIAAGAEILPIGHRLLPQDIGLLASLGRTSVRVRGPLRVAIVNTGNEVVAPGSPLREGQIYDSNGFTLAALLEGLGVEVRRIGIVEDSLTSTVDALKRAASSADFVISTGGVSVGEADYVKQALGMLGRLSLWKLAIKPGKPFSFGWIGTTPFFGLPGNPVAVFVTFLVLVRPYLLKMLGVNEVRHLLYPVYAGFEIREPNTRQEYLRVRVTAGSDGLPTASLYPDQSSSVLTSLSWADGLVVVPAGTTVQAGQIVSYLPFGGAL